MTNARDVARMTGVSVSTVSRALAKPDLVAPETRERVMEAARELGYRPNANAQGLRLGRNHTIGLLVPDLENPFFASVTKAVQSRAHSAGYSVVVADSEEDPANEPELVAMLARRTDGLLVASPRAADDVIATATEGVPAVVLSRRVPEVPSIVADDIDGAAQAIGHLRALGHRRVAAAWGPPTSWSGAHRLEGLHRVTEKHGDVELVELGAFPPYFSGGFVAADHVMASGATAVVAFNDLMALGILGRLSERGLRVPDDVSVVGFDDVAVATLITPALTTVRIPRLRLGQRGVDLLVAQLDGGAKAALAADPGSPLPVELVIRASTAVPPVPGGEPAGRDPEPLATTPT